MATPPASSPHPASRSSSRSQRPASSSPRSFQARFGSEALRLVSRKQTRDRNLRGIYLKVIEDGEVAAGDPVQVIRT